MKILMLAPEPFFQPRGTPISVYFRIKALLDLDHEVDLITYHIGEDKKFKNLKILRIPNLFFIRKVKIGPSLVKIPLDFLLFLKVTRVFCVNNHGFYDGFVETLGFYIFIIGQFLGQWAVRAGENLP